MFLLFILVLWVGYKKLFAYLTKENKQGNLKVWKMGQHPSSAYVNRRQVPNWETELLVWPLVPEDCSFGRGESVCAVLGGTKSRQWCKEHFPFQVALSPDFVYQ